jgi:RNase H-like domain found in reverse transcriptase
MKALLAKDAFLQYLDHNKGFDIYCDASELQLGDAILRESTLVAYYSRKLNSAQRNYTVGEKEILSIVETLICTMLYGCPNIHVFTDHKNNTFERLQTQHVLRWHLFLDDYSIKFHYIKGNSTTLAGACPIYLLMRDRKPMPCLVLGTLSCSSCMHRSPISIFKKYWHHICLYGAIIKPKINPGIFTCHVNCIHHGLSHVGQA